MDGVADDILRLAEEQGFALAGIAPAEPSSYIDAVREWVDEGKHGTMRYLAEHLDVRLDPDRLLEGARSVIAVADLYDAGGSPDPRSPIPNPRPKGKIARYARGDDYHKVIKKRLHTLADALAQRFPGEAFRTTVDTAPALEREHATRAGLGWQARNTMMIHPRHGSYTLLGLIVTTLRVEGTRGRGAEVPSVEPDNSAPRPLDPSAPIRRDHCGHCTRCIDACPTDAIAAEGYSIDASRCVSYLTIEHRGLIDPEFHEGMGDWIAGCDICQEVCPYNAIAARHPLPVLDRYTPRPALGRGAKLDRRAALDRGGPGGRGARLGPQADQARYVSAATPSSPRGTRWLPSEMIRRYGTRSSGVSMTKMTSSKRPPARWWTASHHHYEATRLRRAASSRRLTHCRGHPRQQRPRLGMIRVEAQDLRERSASTIGQAHLLQRPAEQEQRRHVIRLETQRGAERLGRLGQPPVPSARDAEVEPPHRPRPVPLHRPPHHRDRVVQPPGPPRGQAEHVQRPRVVGLELQHLSSRAAPPRRASPSRNSIVAAASTRSKAGPRPPPAPRPTSIVFIGFTAGPERASRDQLTCGSARPRATLRNCRTTPAATARSARSCSPGRGWTCSPAAGSAPG